MLTNNSATRKSLFRDDFDFSPGRIYSTDSKFKPIHFYKEAFKLSSNVDFLLGYFSSYAFEVLGESFFEFIRHGGKMRIAINHFLSERDKSLLYDEDYDIDEDEIEIIISKFEYYLQGLSNKEKFVFDCIRYLIDNDRLEVLPVALKGMSTSHYKNALFYDGTEYLYVNGSANFTRNGLIENGETIAVDVSWEEIGQERIYLEQEKINSIFAKANDAFIYLDSEDIFVGPINRYTESQTLEQLKKKYYKSHNGNFNFSVDDHLQTYTFTPRPYQQEAFDAWNANDFIGLLSMATGTGKTKTALYSIKEIERLEGSYHVVVGVPSSLLLEQWTEEAINFGLQGVFNSSEKNYKQRLKDLHLNLRLGLESNFVFICTYAMIGKGVIQKFFKQDPIPMLFIADEAHNLGASNVMKNVPRNFQKRLGLSATPNRKYDTIGSEFINDYFNCSELGYTYNYSLYRAIKNEFLTPYKYYVHFVSLTDDERERYLELSKKLLKYFDFSSGEFFPGAEMLLILRKRIIHQAENKLPLLEKIISEEQAKGKDMSHTIVYVPEGNSKVDENDVRIINEYAKVISQCGLTTHQITSQTENTELALKNFESGVVQVVTAMKMLDEGVDIPSVQRAIFCASTGNPKQFIQRRGRILRKFNNKVYAEVHDMIVIPSNDYSGLFYDEIGQIREMEEKIFRNEMHRIIDFIYACDNLTEYLTQSTQSTKVLAELCLNAQIDLYTSINEKLSHEEDNN